MSEIVERAARENSPTMRYALLASPRSGSTLVGRMLHQTGCAGDPLEYLNPVLLERARQRLGAEELTYTQFLKIAQDGTTSPNGVFGVHIHLNQFFDAFKTRQFSPQMARFIKGFDKYVWTRRRNRARQAVSWAIARRTKAFSSKDIGRPIKEDDFSPLELINALKLVCMDDFGWEETVKTVGITPKVIWYEDLESNYHACAAEIIDHLGLTDEIAAVPPPPIQKQATELNERLLAKLRSYLALE